MRTTNLNFLQKNTFLSMKVENEMVCVFFVTNLDLDRKLGIANQEGVIQMSS